MDWNTPQKPAEFTESRLIEAILDGLFPINTNLPAERDLAARLGVTRPTLREALQRLARDGWIEIRHGKPTRVRDYWHEGSLGVLGVLARRSSDLPDDFILHLLEVRLALAPAYARLAVERQPVAAARWLEQRLTLPDQAQAFAAFDWALHHQLAGLSGNPIFTLILNGFNDVYLLLAGRYFQDETARSRSRAFYSALWQAALANDPAAAENITRRVMGESMEHWKAVQTFEGLTV